MTPMPSSVTARSPHLAASRYGTTPGERLVRLADRLLNGADRPGADSARRGHLPTHDRPRLLQRALRRHHSGAHQRRIDLGLRIRLPAVLDRIIAVRIGLRQAWSCRSSGSSMPEPLALATHRA